jgi:hypothetical protein
VSAVSSTDPITDPDEIPVCPPPGEVIDQAVVDAGFCRQSADEVAAVFAANHGNCVVASWGTGWGVVGKPAIEGEATLGDAGPCETQATPATEPPATAPPSAATLFGDSTLTFPAGERDSVAVVAFGPPLNDGAMPVVVQNNNDHVVYEISVSGTARDAAGTLIGTGESQGVEPVELAPGGLGIGYVYFGLDTLPPDAQVEMTARGETSRQPLGRVGLTIQELNLVPGDYSQQFVGTVKNETAEEVTGPISVLVACFDEGGQPIDTVNGFTNEDSLAPDTVGSFTLTLSDIDVCPRFLAGSSGFNW